MQSLIAMKALNLTNPKRTSKIKRRMTLNRKEVHSAYRHVQKK